jgi:hypothetical protein
MENTNKTDGKTSTDKMTTKKYKVKHVDDDEEYAVYFSTIREAERYILSRSGYGITNTKECE